MNSTKNSTLGLDFFLSEPADADEFNQLAGNPNACVSDANNNVKYRSTYPGIRAAFVEKLAEFTGEPRKTKPKKNAAGEAVTKDGEPVLVTAETEKTYYNRLLLGKYEEVDRDPLTKEEAQSLMDELQKESPDTFVLDPTPATRSTKAPKEIEGAADNILARIEAGETDGEKVFTNIAAVLGAEVETLGEFSRENLVAALVAVKTKEDRERADRFA